MKSAFFTIFAMKTVASTIALALMLPFNAVSGTLISTQSDISLKKELDRTISNGFDFLKKSQNPDGSWSSPDFPALTGLVLYAFFTSPDYDPSAPRPPFIQKGLDFIVSHAKEDGAIYNEQLPNYNTAICMTALTASGMPPTIHIS